MNLDLAPTGVAMMRNHLQQAAVVLLRGIKIRMDKRTAVIVTPPVHHFRILAAPPLDAPFLLRARNTLVTAFQINRRLKMIRYGDDQVHRFADSSGERPPSSAGQHFPAIRNFLPETHLSS